MLPSDGVIRWLFEAWAWLQRRRGGPDEFRRAALITPTGEDFPVDAALEGEELAEDYFLFVHEHARLPDWPLVPVPERLAPDEGEGAEAETETEPDEAEVLYWVLDAYQLATVRRNEAWWRDVLGPALAKVWAAVGIFSGRTEKHS